MRTKLFLSGAVVLLLAWAGAAHSQAYFKCTDAEGNVSFSDRLCEKGDASSVKAAKDVDSPSRKQANDVLIQRDKALADRVQSSRVAQERARYAAQDGQVQASRGIAATVGQERAQQQSSAPSKLAPSTSLATQPATY